MAASATVPKTLGLEPDPNPPPVRWPVALAVLRLQPGRDEVQATAPGFPMPVARPNADLAWAPSGPNGAGKLAESQAPPAPERPLRSRPHRASNLARPNINPEWVEPASLEKPKARQELRSTEQ